MIIVKCCLERYRELTTPAYIHFNSEVSEKDLKFIIMNQKTEHEVATGTET